MLANALFYDVNKMSHSTFIQVGPLKFTWRQVMVGFHSALIVAPVNIFIAFLFEKGSLRTSGDQQNQASNKRKWLTNVAWLLCVLTSSLSAALTMFYSLVWKKRISEQWLSSMVISFLLDVTITEPIKVFLRICICGTHEEEKATRKSSIDGCQRNASSIMEAKTLEGRGNAKTSGEKAERIPFVGRTCHLCSIHNYSDHCLL